LGREPETQERSLSAVGCERASEKRKRKKRSAWRLHVNCTSSGALVNSIPGTCWSAIHMIVPCCLVVPPASKSRHSATSEAASRESCNHGEFPSPVHYTHEFYCPVSRVSPSLRQRDVQSINKISRAIVLSTCCMPVPASREREREREKIHSRASRRLMG